MLERLFNLEVVYVASGIVLAVFGVFTALDRGNPRRYGTALFWLLLSVIFALGSLMPAWLTGLLVIGLVVVDGLGLVRHGDYHESTHEEQARSADAIGYLLFLPVLMIPVLGFAATKSFTTLRPDLDGNTILYVCLGLSSVLAGVLALGITGGRPVQLVHDGRRLADAIGAAVVLPQLLASLGELFKAAGVGTVIAGLVSAVIPTGSLFAVILVCCATIAVFTFIMGNSFAAFPVIMAGIGVPLLIVPFQVDPALVGALVITVASCGTLCTPMAANFNIVPPALFEMRDRYGVIKFQAPFAGVMFVVHVLLLWALASVFSVAT